jgi:hypothetical protein
MTLTEILNGYIAERAEIENVDVEGLVKAKLAEIEVEVRTEIEEDIANKRKIVDIKIDTMQHAIEQVAAVESQTEDVDETVDETVEDSDNQTEIVY